MPKDKGHKKGHKYDSRKTSTEARLKPLNLTPETQEQATAVAIRDEERNGRNQPVVSAAGRGEMAEKILRLAFDNDVRVRQDSALADMLAGIDLDSPVPSEAFMAVAEVLAYVYRADGAENPYDAILNTDSASAYDDNSE